MKKSFTNAIKVLKNSILEWGGQIAKMAITLVLLCSSNLSMNAQTYDSLSNYYAITAQMDSYYDSIMLNRGADSMEGTGFKQYQRWKNFAWPRIDENGELTNYMTNVNNYFSTANKSTNSEFVWSYTGPKGLFDHLVSGTGKGWVNRLLFDESIPGTIFAGTHNSGVWKTTDGGQNWYLITANYPQINGIASMFRSKDATQTIYVATSTNISNYSNGVYKSVDNGLSWDYLPINYIKDGTEVDLYPNSNIREIPRKIIEHPFNPNVLFLLTESSVYKSVNKGLNWTRTFHEDELPTWEGKRYNDLEFDGRNQDVMYLGGYKVLKSTDGGETWNQDITYQITDETEIDFCIMDVKQGSEGDVWFFYNKKQDNGSGIVKYDVNTGIYTSLKSWSDNYYQASDHKAVLKVDPLDENRIIVGGIRLNVLNLNSSTIYETWPINRNYFNYIIDGAPDNYVHSDIRDFYFYRQNNNDKLIVACDGGVSKGVLQGYDSFNGKDYEHWTFEDLSVKGSDYDKQLNINEIYALSTNGQNGNIIFNSQDVGGYEIRPNELVRLHGGDGGGILYDDNKPDYHYTYEYQIVGSFWMEKMNVQQFPDIPIGVGDNRYFAPIIKDPADANVLYTGVKKLFKFSDIYNSNNFIDYDFNQESQPGEEKKDIHRLTDIEISKNNTNLIFVSTERNYAWTGVNPPDYTYAFFKSTDKGANWQDISANILGLKNGFITDIKINPHNDNELWLCFGKATGDLDAQTAKKVYKSTDGGLSFTAFTDGLPEEIPVWDMEYDIRTDFLYIATDIGVFSRPADGTTEWSDISAQADGTYPITMVTDIEINNKSHKLYAGTFGRGIWETQLSDCPVYNNSDLIVDSDQTWVNPHFINKNLIVPAGVTLTIKSEVYFNSKSRFIIMPGEGNTPGGHLILDGAILTNDCSDVSWKGIEVWGNGYVDQNPLYQGWITMKNNSVISNAEIGILANNTDYQNAAFDYHGGIVHLSNSTFRNNIVSVKLEDYHFQTFNQINNCLFITDETWAHVGASPESFISYSNYGYETNTNGRSYKQEIKGCSFENYRYAGDPTQSQQWGTGIYAFSTWVVVDNLELHDGMETYYKPSEFKHLHIGVDAIGNENMLPFTVSNSNFVQNKEAINLSNIYDAEITLNDIEVLNITDSHGLYLYYCPTGYHIEANNFWSNGNTAENYGIIVHNSGSYPNLIYNNSFSDLYYASAAQGANRNKTTGEGLQFKCNTYTNNKVDLSVKDNNIYTGYGIADHQGKVPENASDYEALAGNVFTSEYIYSDHLWDIYNEDGENRFTYHFYIPDEPSDPKTNPSENKVFSSSAYPVTLFLAPENENLNVANYTVALNCPSTLSDNSGGATTKSLVQMYSQAIDSINNEILILKDGGDTPNLYNDTENAMSGEELQTKNMLLEDSPNLSDSVLVSSVQNEEALPNAMLRDVLIENPRAAKSNEVQISLDNRINQLPDYMRDEIDQSGDTISELEVKRAALSYYNLKKKIELSHLINLYRKDTNSINLNDSLINVFELMDDVNSEYRKAMLYVANNDTSSSDSVVLAMNVKFNLDNTQLDERQSFIDYLNVKKQILRDSLNTPDSIALAGFEDIYYNGYGSVVILSSFNLERAGLIDIQLPHYKIDTSTTKSARCSNKYHNQDKEVSLSLLRLKPNPAKNYFIVEYELPDEVDNAIITVHSVNGIKYFVAKLNRKIDEIVVNTDNMPSGIYTVSLVSGSAILESSKLSLIK